MEFGKPFRPLYCGSVWRDASGVGLRAICKVSLLIILFVALEIGRCILLKRIRHFECSAVYVGIYICAIVRFGRGKVKGLVMPPCSWVA
jgi:hypothetical protein